MRCLTFWIAQQRVQLGADGADALMIQFAVQPHGEPVPVFLIGKHGIIPFAAMFGD